MNNYKLDEKELLFAKVKNVAKIPYKRDEDGCYDIYACFDDDNIVIPPHEIALIPTGIASAFSSKYRLAIRERGSNTKSALITVAGQVDSGYRGEIFVALYNSTKLPISISKSVDEIVHKENYTLVPYNKAIAQFAMEEVPNLNVCEIDYEDLKEIDSERGIGKLGSTEK